MEEAQQRARLDRLVGELHPHDRKELEEWLVKRVQERYTRLF